MARVYRTCCARTDNIFVEYRNGQFMIVVPLCGLQTIDQLIETGDSEQIFQKAIQEQGRGQVSRLS